MDSDEDDEDDSDEDDDEYVLSSQLFPVTSQNIFCDNLIPQT